MSLRARFVLALVGLVAVATALIGAFSYRTTRAELLGQLDSSLQATTADLRRPGGVDRVLGPRSPASIRGDSDVIVQVVGADGTVYSMDGAAPLPVGVSAEDLLDEPEGTFRWQDDSVDGTAVRVLTTSLGGGRGVLQVGRSLSETRQVLAALRTRILVASLVVVAAAAAVGVVLARQLTRRLVRLTAAAEEVRRSGRLDVDVDTDGTDEAARLGVAFREMLGALARSREDQQRLVQDAGIIRHRGKITSTINNAKRALELRDEFGSLAAYFWAHEPDASERPATLDWDTLKTMGKTATSTAISKDLKKRGWSFVGPTTVYAFMQAMGLVNDHIEGCCCRPEVEAARAAFQRPA